jgi:hypothetical protein
VPAGVTGLAVALGGKLVALDVFDSPATLRKQWPRLIESAASAALDHRRQVAAGMLPKPEHRHPDSGALGRMLSRAKRATAEATVKRSVGEGWDIRLMGRKLHGSALVHEGRVVHVALFRHEPPQPPPPPTPRRHEPPAEDGTPPDQRTRDGLAELMRRMEDGTVRAEPPDAQPAGVPAEPVR